jgi:hypothetical protein
MPILPGRAFARSIKHGGKTSTRIRMDQQQRQEILVG